MSYADQVFMQNIREILDHGVWDTDQNVRPHWEDGTPAHTIKKFGIVNRYDLSKEFPLLTLRRTYWKTAVDELLWIWQKKPNNVHDLNAKIWDQWADETGSIGKRYRRQDAIGTPYCVTVDHQTLEDGCVTLRDRDTMKQERVAIADLDRLIADRVSITSLLKTL